MKLPARLLYVMTILLAGTLHAQPSDDSTPSSESAKANAEKSIRKLVNEWCDQQVAAMDAYERDLERIVAFANDELTELHQDHLNYEYFKIPMRRKMQQDFFERERKETSEWHQYELRSFIASYRKTIASQRKHLVTNVTMQVRYGQNADAKAILNTHVSTYPDSVSNAAATSIRHIWKVWGYQYLGAGNKVSAMVHDIHVKQDALIKEWEQERDRLPGNLPSKEYEARWNALRKKYRDQCSAVIHSGTYRKRHAEIIGDLERRRLRVAKFIASITNDTTRYRGLRNFMTYGHNQGFMGEPFHPGSGGQYREVRNRMDQSDIAKFDRQLPAFDIRDAATGRIAIPQISIHKDRINKTRETTHALNLRIKAFASRLEKALPGRRDQAGHLMVSVDDRSAMVKKSQGLVPKAEPVSKVNIQGLLLIREATIAQFQQFLAQLKAIQKFSGQQRLVLAKHLTKGAGELNEAYKRLNINKPRSFDRHGRRVDYKAYHRDLLNHAKLLNRAGAHAAAVEKRHEADESGWGHYTRQRKKFYKQLNKHPLLSVYGDPSWAPMDEGFLFQALDTYVAENTAYGMLAHADDRAKWDKGLLELFDTFIGLGIKNAVSNIDQANNATDVADLTEYGSPKYAYIHGLLTGRGEALGTTLPGQYINSAQGYYDEITAEAEPENIITTSVIIGASAIGAVFVPGVGGVVIGILPEATNEGSQVVQVWIEDGQVREMGAAIKFDYLNELEDRFDDEMADVSMAVLFGIGGEGVAKLGAESLPVLAPRLAKWVESLGKGADDAADMAMVKLDDGTRTFDDVLDLPDREMVHIDSPDEMPPNQGDGTSTFDEVLDPPDKDKTLSIDSPDEMPPGQGDGTSTFDEVLDPPSAHKTPKPKRKGGGGLDALAGKPQKTVPPSEPILVSAKKMAKIGPGSKIVTGDGQSITLGPLLGAGTFADAYHIVGRPGDVIKFVKRGDKGPRTVGPLTPMETARLDKAASDLLDDRNISQLRIHDVGKTTDDVPYIIQQKANFDEMEVFGSKKAQEANPKLKTAADWTDEHSQAVVKLYESMAGERIVWEDGHGKNIYFFRNADNKLRAGVLDHGRMGDWNNLDPLMRDWVESAAKNAEVFKIMSVKNIPEGKYRFSGPEEFMAKMLEHKHWIKFNPKTGKFVGRRIKLRHLRNSTLKLHSGSAYPSGSRLPYRFFPCVSHLKMAA